MINGDGRDVTDFERDFRKPSNSNDATFAGDDLLKTRAVFEYDRDNLVTGSGFFLSFQASGSFRRNWH